MIKTTLLVVLLAIFVATIQAANPFDTNNRPFVIGGKFKRVERKNPGASFACYNTTLGDWSEYKWTDATAAATSGSVVQLNNGQVISVIKIPLDTGNTYGFLYWTIDASSIITTTATVMEANSAPRLVLSYDQKKLYALGTFTRVGGNTYTDNKFRIFSFDISSLPTLSAPSEITSNYNINTVTLTQGTVVYPVSNSNQLVFVLSGAQMIVFDPTSTSWKEINPTVIKADSEFKLSSTSGELFARSYDNASPYTSSFWKYDPSNSASFTIVKTLAQSTFVSSGNPKAYIGAWTVGGSAIYFVTNPTLNTNDYENGMQNIQKVTLSSGSAADPVLLGKSRLTTATTIRASVDYTPLSTYVTSMYFDETTKQLIINLNADVAYQVHGARDTDSNKKIYELNYRFQPMGKIVAYDSATDLYVTPYGGAFTGTVSRPNIYASTVSASCFFAIGAYYRTWAPNFAVYDQGKDMFVAENLLSGQFDYDWTFNISPEVNAIENSDDASIVYVGGRFRTISGTVYNSIVARSKTGLAALGTGLRKHNFAYNTFDTLPGTVSKLIRSKDNRYLFVAGDFDRAGDLYVNNLAYWNIEKKTWNKLETHNIKNIAAMDYDGRYLYVVGAFTQAGKYVVKNAARFDMESQTWLPMNGGLDSDASTGMVVDGKFVAVIGSGSGVSFTANLAVWSSNAWRAVQMEKANNEGCSLDKEICTSGLTGYTATYYKGKIYFLSTSKVYVADTSMNKGVLYANGLVGAQVTTNTRFFNYPKSNTIAVADIGATKFTEYNIDTKNIQHTVTRDENELADASINAFSAAPKNVVAVVAMIVALVVTLFF